MLNREIFILLLIISFISGGEMGKIPEEDIERVRDAVDIVEVIGGYVPLKRSGRSYATRCPFHQEKTASFHVFPESQIFKCFGCGKSGSVYTFLMVHEKMEFPEAVQTMADRAGISIRTDNYTPEQKREQEAIYAALRSATMEYRANLLNNSEESKKALNYLINDRGITQKSIDTFCIGYAPDNWDFILNKLRGEFRDHDLESAGLIIESRNGGFYDRFRGRIIFPICDQRGKVRGFGGRIPPWNEADNVPKYTNSPSNPIYDKGKLLYLLHKARDVLRDTGYMIVVEGYTDAILLQQEGIKNAVATCGTALTLEHTRLIKRYVKNVIHCFDADEGGIKSMIKSAEPMFYEGLSFKTILLPKEQDPASFVQKHKEEGFRAEIEKAKPVFELSLERIIQGKEIKSVDDKIRVLTEIAPMMRFVIDPIMQAVYFEKIARVLDQDYASVVDALTAKKPVSERIEIIRLTFSKINDLEKEIAKIILQKPTLRAYLGNQISMKYFRTPEIKAIFGYLTSEDVRDDILSYKNGFDKDIPLFGELFTTQLPEDIIEFAKRKKIILDESQVYSMVTEFGRGVLQKTSPAIALSLANKLKNKCIHEDFKRALETGGPKKVKELLDKQTDS